MSISRYSQTELVIGLVGAIGTNLGHVSTRLCSLLGDTFEYDCTQIKVSELLTALDWPAARQLTHRR